MLKGLQGPLSKIRPFKNRSKSELLNLLFISGFCSYPYLVRRSHYLLDMSVRLIGMESTCFYIDRTAGRIFSAGSTPLHLLSTMEFLRSEGKVSIADYCAEGEKTREGFDKNAQAILDSAAVIASYPGSSMALKLTGLMSSQILSKLNIQQTLAGDSFHSSILKDFSYKHLQKFNLEHEEILEIQESHERIQYVIAKLIDHGVTVMVDAEQTYYQNAIDAWTYTLQKQFNKEQGLVSNTFQCYLIDSYHRLQRYIQLSRAENRPIAIKLVRGAYIIEENNLAYISGVDSPIHPTREDTHQSYNTSLRYVLENFRDGDFLCVATHNRESTVIAREVINQRNIHKRNGGVMFAQLLGMKDMLSAELVDDGYLTGKYTPFGPPDKLIPYLMRRAAEQSEVVSEMKEQINMVLQELTLRYKK